MKVSITGHTNGVGRALADHLRDKWSADVTGFSLSNGYDISKQEDRERIMQLNMTCSLIMPMIITTWVMVLS